MSAAEELLYRCIRELAYWDAVGCLECGHGATSNCKALVDEGMELLGTKDLEAETWAGAAPHGGRK